MCFLSYVNLRGYESKMEMVRDVEREKGLVRAQ
jgi:hypothetical protein